jgi:hypothetical protein
MESVLASGLFYGAPPRPGGLTLHRWSCSFAWWFSLQGFFVSWFCPASLLRVAGGHDGAAMSLRGKQVFPPPAAFVPSHESCHEAPRSTKRSNGTMRCCGRPFSVEQRGRTVHTLKVLPALPRRRPLFRIRNSPQFCRLDPSPALEYVLVCVAGIILLFIH